MNVEAFAPQPARFVRFTTLATLNDNLREPCLDELEVYTAEPEPRNVALAACGTIATSSGNYSETGIHQLKHINEGEYGNSHSWISNEVGGGWVQLEFPAIETINRIHWSRDREGQFADRLAVDYRIEVSLDGMAWTRVASSDDRLPIGAPHDELQMLLRHANDQRSRLEQSTVGQASEGQASDGSPYEDLAALASQLDRLEKQRQSLLTPQLVYAGSFRGPDTTYVLRRGDPEQKEDEIGPSVPAVLGGEPISPETAEQRRRSLLADWIASPDNPLTARVLVNRVWQYHFGQGLVETPSDFGVNGASPSHPELLDWLASEFIADGWSIKDLHRRILLSETYRQSNAIDPDSQRIDNDCRLLWRFPSRRLEGEAIRDSLLAVNGQLNLEMGGPGFDFFKTRGGLSGFPPVDQFGPAQLRRMIYSHKIRMEPVPVFGAFDCPDAGQAMPQRGTVDDGHPGAQFVQQSVRLRPGETVRRAIGTRISGLTGDGNSRVPSSWRLDESRTIAKSRRASKWRSSMD